MLYVVAIQNASDFGKQFEFVKGRLSRFTSVVVCLTSTFHLDLERSQLFVNLIFEILVGDG
jgi:hypothetical protein